MARVVSGVVDEAPGAATGPAEPACSSRLCGAATRPERRPGHPRWRVTVAVLRECAGGEGSVLVVPFGPRGSSEQVRGPQRAQESPGLPGLRAPDGLPVLPQGASVKAASSGPASGRGSMTARTGTVTPAST
ncbi:hypothetical protein GCM10023205_57960 [Yinghuangia aomiensis]|uniref:Uncharacterized protein n=1 Tax=Yinghuangia aomiensis TaxID=676205 RepID=A0ABP9HXQ6_9ACTN